MPILGREDSYHQVTSYFNMMVWYCRLIKNALNPKTCVPFWFRELQWCYWVCLPLEASWRVIHKPHIWQCLSDSKRGRNKSRLYTADNYPDSHKHSGAWGNKTFKRGFFHNCLYSLQPMSTSPMSYGCESVFVTPCSLPCNWTHSTSLNTNKPNVMNNQ